MDCELLQVLNFARHCNNGVSREDAISICSAIRRIKESYGRAIMINGSAKLMEYVEAISLFPMWFCKYAYSNQHNILYKCNIHPRINWIELLYSLQILYGIRIGTNNSMSLK